MMLREVTVPEVWRIKPGAVEKRDAWNSITETLLKIQSPKFDVSPRAVRERFSHLLSKRKAKNWEEEAALGISPEPKEADTLLDELLEIFGTADLEHKAATEELKQKQAADIAKAQEMRQQSVETLGESRKRKLWEEGGKGSMRRNEEEQAFSFDAGDCPRPRHRPRRMIYEGSRPPSQKRVSPPGEKCLKNCLFSF